MHNTSFGSIGAGIVLAVVLALPPRVNAQPVPDAGQIAAGIDLGWFVPTDDQFESSIAGGGYFEFYLSPRIGLRTGATAARPSYARGVDEQERQLRLGADLVYNWEGGRVHPFAGAGVGWHLLRLYERGENVGPNHNKLGLSLLGGAEVFLSRAWTLKGEARYQWVADTPLVDPGGFAFTVGLKRYF